jgi:hypothetical protein
VRKIIEGKMANDTKHPRTSQKHTTSPTPSKRPRSQMSHTHDIQHFFDRMSPDEQYELDTLLTRV